MTPQEIQALCQRTSTNPLEQSRHRYSHRISMLYAETRPSAETRTLRQCGQILSRVSLGDGPESDLTGWVPMGTS